MVYITAVLILQRIEDIARRAGYRDFPLLECKRSHRCTPGNHVAKKTENSSSMINSLPGFTSFETKERLCML